jgi:redox-sensitive bicupin YhaK (pirin superfamily)
VINEDVVAPEGGFSTHPHANMEIVSIVLSGALAHRDSIGNVQTIQAGEVQRMSAGTGIEHSEFNPSSSEPVHFLQVWLLPRHRDRPPSYDQRVFDESGRRGRWQTVVTPDGREGSLAIDQDAGLHLAMLPAGSALTRPLESGRRAFLQVVSGALDAGGQSLNAGDGLAISGADELVLRAGVDSAVLLFDLA